MMRQRIIFQKKICLRHIPATKPDNLSRCLKSGCLFLVERLAEGHGRYTCFAFEYLIERLRVFETKLVSYLRHRKAAGAKHFLRLFYKLIVDMLLGILTGIYAQQIAEVVWRYMQAIGNGLYGRQACTAVIAEMLFQQVIELYQQLVTGRLAGNELAVIKKRFE